MRVILMLLWLEGQSDSFSMVHIYWQFSLNTPLLQHKALAECHFKTIFFSLRYECMLLFVEKVFLLEI
jgi:hypothetical protein